MDETNEYGYRNPLWMLKALLINTKRDKLNIALIAVLDVLEREQDEGNSIEPETIFELLSQLLAVGQAFVATPPTEHQIREAFFADGGFANDGFAGGHPGAFMDEDDEDEDEQGGTPDA